MTAQFVIVGVVIVGAVVYVSCRLWKEWRHSQSGCSHCPANHLNSKK